MGTAHSPVLPGELLCDAGFISIKSHSIVVFTNRCAWGLFAPGARRSAERESRTLGTSARRTRIAAAGGAALLAEAGGILSDHRSAGGVCHGEIAGCRLLQPLVILGDDSTGVAVGDEFAVIEQDCAIAHLLDHGF